MRQGGVFASRSPTWPRDHFWRRTIAPLRSRPTTWKEFLPMSIPITAIWVFDVLGMGVLLCDAAPVQRQPLAGREHGRTIPLADMLDRPAAPAPVDPGFSS